MRVNEGTPHWLSPHWLIVTPGWWKVGPMSLPRKKGNTTQWQRPRTHVNPGWPFAPRFCLLTCRLLTPPTKKKAELHVRQYSSNGMTESSRWNSNYTTLYTSRQYLSHPREAHSVEIRGEGDSKATWKAKLEFSERWLEGGGDSLNQNQNNIPLEGYTM